MAMTPSEVCAHEATSLDRNRSNYCGMFGCAETECAAQTVVEWLAANGDDWATPLDMAGVAEFINTGTEWTIETQRGWLVSHVHEYGGECVFADWLDDTPRGPVVSAEMRKRLERSWS